jgi:hypothetical protein
MLGGAVAPLELQELALEDLMQSLSPERMFRAEFERLDRQVWGACFASARLLHFDFWQLLLVLYAQTFTSAESHYLD